MIILQWICSSLSVRGYSVHFRAAFPCYWQKLNTNLLLGPISTILCRKVDIIELYFRKHICFHGDWNVTLTDVVLYNTLSWPSWEMVSIIELIGMDVPDQYIWSKGNLKQKMDEFRLYFNNCFCFVFGVQPYQLGNITMFEISWNDLDKICTELYDKHYRTGV